MPIFQLFNKVSTYVKTYRKLVIAALTLTIIGSLLAQINAHILRYTVDQLEVLVNNVLPLRDFS